MTKRRKRYNEEILSDKKKRLKYEMDKYKYHDKKIKQFTIEEINNSKPLNNKKKK